MCFFWPKRNHLTMSSEYAMVTYDVAVNDRGIKYPTAGPSSCEWIVPGTIED